jgi:putative endonuclease
MKTCYVYILASKRNGTLYVGMTNNIQRRIREHKAEINEGFSKRYAVKQLFYFESHPSPGLAIKREKRVKKWNRAWKLSLIEEMNPTWKDLSQDWE